MIKVLNTATFLLVLIMFISCAIANREEVSMASEVPAGTTHSLLEKQLHADELGPEVLKAFELKAFSKLKECYEYFQVISDQGYDTAFRRQAITQTLTLFSDTTVFPQTGLDDSAVSLPLFLEDLYLGKWEKTSYKVSQLALKEPLLLNADRAYKGQVTYLLQLNDQYISEEPVLQDIVVKKVTTDFGTDTTEVWKVFLGK